VAHHGPSRWWHRGGSSPVKASKPGNAGGAGLNGSAEGMDQPAMGEFMPERSGGQTTPGQESTSDGRNRLMRWLTLFPNRWSGRRIRRSGNHGAGVGCRSEAFETDLKGLLQALESHVLGKLLPPPVRRSGVPASGGSGRWEFHGRRRRVAQMVVKIIWGRWWSHPSRSCGYRPGSRR
jgi:hypothetical protein